MPKRKRGSDSDYNRCIIHNSSLNDYGNFTPLNKLKQGTPIEKLQQLLDIRDRRLNQAHDSPFRMESACDLIPSTLPEDLDCVGYHRHCYQRFTSNLDRLDKKFEASSETHQQERPKSSRRSTSASASILFPPDCIFCEKKEVKVDRKTERAECFLS